MAPAPGEAVSENGARATPPLEGLRVLSMAEQLPGPFATLLLADLGADVVLVERPPGGDPARSVPSFFAALGRGKRSVALDLKQEPARAAFYQLASGADALLEGFRPGVVDRLGVGYRELSTRNPALIYVSISGFGQEGPYRDRPAHDLSYQAMAGVFHGQGARLLGAPPPMVTLADLAAGLYAVIAVLTGLAGRARTGRGSYIDVAMFDTTLSLLTAQLVPVLNGTGPPTLPPEPAYGVFATRDGRLLTLSISYEDRFWDRLCGAAGLGDLAGLGQAERVTRHGELTERLAAAVATRDLQEWLELLTEQDVPCGPVNSLGDLAADEHVRDRGLLVDVEQEPGVVCRHLRQPLVIDGHAPGPRRGVPGVGEHTREVLREAGIPDARIEALIGAERTRTDGRQSC